MFNNCYGIIAFDEKKYCIYILGQNGLCTTGTTVSGSPSFVTQRKQMKKGCGILTSKVNLIFLVLHNHINK